MSWLYRTCWNNLATSPIILTRLLQVVNRLFQTCRQFGTSSSNTTCWQAVGGLTTRCQIFTPVIQLSSQLRVRMIITWSLLKFISRSQASPATRLQSSYNRCTLRDAIVYTRDVRGHYCINIVIHLYYVLFKTRVVLSVLSDIKHEAQSSVLYLIKHDNKCFE